MGLPPLFVMRSFASGVLSRLLVQTHEQCHRIADGFLLRLGLLLVEGRPIRRFLTGQMVEGVGQPPVVENLRKIGSSAGTTMSIIS